MNDLFMQLGVAGILILLFLKEMFAYLKTRDAKKNALIASPKSDYDQGHIIETIDDNVKWLRNIHNVKDKDGVPIWYFRSSLEELLKILADNSKTQTELLTAMNTKIDKIKEE